MHNLKCITRLRWSPSAVGPAVQHCFCLLPINTHSTVHKEASDFMTDRHLILALHKPLLLNMIAPRDVSFPDYILFIHSHKHIKNIPESNCYVIDEKR